jgi:hypothetical protein
MTGQGIQAVRAAAMISSSSKRMRAVSIISALVAAMAPTLVRGRDPRCGGRLSATIGPCRLADLGPGKLDDFLEIDPTTIQIHFTPANEVVSQPGNVYLLDQKAPRHWVLFQFDYGPEENP